MTAATTIAQTVEPSNVQQLKPRAPSLKESRFSLASYASNRYAVTIEAGMPIEAVMEPTFWAHVARKLRPCDILEIHTEDGAWFAELYVRAARKTEATVCLMRKVELESAPFASADTEPVTIQFRGPHARYCLMRGKVILSDKHQTQEDAELALAAHRKTFAA